MSSSSALGRTLPALKLTAHDPRLMQVFTTPPSHLSRGDFGFKAPLQTALNAARHHRQGQVRYVQLKDQDSSAGLGLQWKEREGEVLLLTRWGETNTPIEMADFTRLNSTSILGPEKPKKTVQPLPHSRFDRTSRRSLPTQRSAIRSPSSAPPPTTDSTASVPHYLAYSEERFERMLNIIRNNRQAYKDARILQRALDQCSAKYFAARRRYEALVAESDHASAAGGGQASLPAPPKEEDFSVEAEIEAIRNVSPAGEADEVELDPIDMYNLARSTHNYFLSKYIEELFSKLKLDDPSSKVMPRYVTASASSSKAAEAYGPRRLHELGGLQYSQPDEIFANILSPPLPGRVLSLADQLARRKALTSSTSFNSKKYAVSLGSQVHSVRHSRSGGTQLVPFDRTRERPEQGVGLFRFDSEVKMRLVHHYLDTLPRQRRFGGGADGAWSSDIQHLGLGYISAEVRGTYNDTTTLRDRAPIVGEQMARAEFIPGTRGWVGKNEESTGWSRTRMANPLGSRFADRYGFDGGNDYDRSPNSGSRAAAGSARYGPGGRFSRPPGAGGVARTDGRISLDRGHRRSGLGGNQAQQEEQQPQRRESISALLFGQDDRRSG